MHFKRAPKSSERRRYKCIGCCSSMRGEKSIRLTGELPRCWTPIRAGIQDAYILESWHIQKEPSVMNRDRGNLPRIYRTLLGTSQYRCTITHAQLSNHTHSHHSLFSSNHHHSAFHSLDEDTRRGVETLGHKILIIIDWL